MKKSEIERLSLSEKIRLFNIYESHPLRSQYITEKAALMKRLKSKNKKRYNKYFYKKLIPALLIIIYFVAFALALSNYDDLCPLIIILGLLNLGVCYRVFINSTEENPIINLKEYKDFIEKYEALGVIEITENDLFSGNCVEEDSYGNYICGATKQQLSYKQQCQCTSIINKEECRKCVVAIYGEDAASNWPREFKQ